MASTKTLHELLQNLFSQQRLAVLSTSGAGQPYCSLVGFAVSEDLRHVVFATPRGTRKFANMAADSRVALLIDNRSNRASDFKRSIAATVIGTVKEQTKRANNPLVKRYLQKHPSLKAFLRQRDCALMKVAVDRYVVVDHFQRVAEFTPPGDGL